MLEFEGLKVAKELDDTADNNNFKFFRWYRITYAENIHDILRKTTDVDYSCMFICEKNGTQKMVADALDHIVNDAKGIKQILSYEADIDEADFKSVENMIQIL